MTWIGYTGWDPPDGVFDIEVVAIGWQSESSFVVFWIGKTRIGDDDWSDDEARLWSQQITFAGSVFTTGTPHMLQGGLPAGGSWIMKVERSSTGHFAISLSRITGGST